MSHPLPRAVSAETIRELLMASQRCWPAEGRGGPPISSPRCTRSWMRLFILASGQRECPDEHLSSPFVSMADTAFQELQIECLSPVRPTFSLLTCRRRAGDERCCQIASLWKCWCKNRQQYSRKTRKREEKNKDLFFPCLPNTQETPIGRHYLASKSKTAKIIKMRW